ncbi:MULTISPECIES: hypothetical protein [Fusobacterium]|uniref:HTH cro/C1-type domain-containing protein n=1 Tax=Fusobacterium ulcerans 12-1B TaxID=457404 RepID=S2L1S9_9FUSO|nr:MULTISPECIES: hypothetical protein [Fusobacterium]EPC09150.1 hypothetical protein HMPREF0402_04127 [Fusobacterium ulcerans 12-1B]
MKEELIELQKKIGEDFLEKIENYKKENDLSYKEVAKLVGISNYYFGNLRNKIKNKGILPSEKVMKKFEKIGIN